MSIKKLLLLTSCTVFIAATAQAGPLTNFDSYRGSVDLGVWKTAATVGSEDYGGLYRFNGALTVGVGGPWGLQYRYHNMDTKNNLYPYFINTQQVGLYSEHYKGTTNEFNLLYSLGKDSHWALFAGLNRVSSQLVRSGYINNTLEGTQSVFQGGLVGTIPLGHRVDAYLLGGLGSHGLSQLEAGLSAKVSNDWQANVGYRSFQIDNAVSAANGDVKVKGITFGLTYLFGSKTASAATPVQSSDGKDSTVGQQPVGQQAIGQEPVGQQVAVAQPPAQKVILQSVLFDFDKDTLQQQAYPILGNVVTVANNNPSWTYVLIGNTDSTGPAAYNLDLSKRRVQTVQNYLINQGIPASHLSIDEKGEGQPISTNDTAEGRAQNRRVEIHIN